MKNLVPTKFDSLAAGVFGNVVVSKNGKTGTKFLKLCKLNSRTILFIEVDKENRVNTFRKFKVKDITELGYDENNVLTYIVKDGVMPDKWESSWDTIGSYSPAVQKYGKFYSNHSKGWAPKLACNHKYVATGVVSNAGFPMV